MSLTKNTPDFIESDKPSKVTKKGIRAISEMTTPRILWYVTCRHSSGLKTLAIVSMVSYLAYDKVLKTFL